MRSISIAIVGAGQAGAELARTLRQGGFAGSISMFGREASLPYERPPLSKKLLQGALEPNRLTLGGRESYERHGVELLTDAPVGEIAPEAGTIRLARGDTFGFDTCVLATGAQARRPTFPGADLQDVHVLRTVEDALALRSALKAGARLAVVGGGYLGLEVASSARALGVEVFVIESGARVMRRSVSALTASALEARHRSAGIHLLLETSVRAIEGETRAERIVTSKGEAIDVDAVLLAIGAEPGIELAERAGLHCDNGIVTNVNGRASTPNIYAIGDCASSFDPTLDQHCRLEAVNAALADARRAAADLLGRPPPPVRPPYFWSEQHDLKLQIAGIPRRGIACDDVLRGDLSSSFAVYRFQERKLVAVEAVNRPKDFVRAMGLIGSRDVTLSPD